MCCLILGCCSLLCKTRTGLSDLFRIIVFVLRYLERQSAPGPATIGLQVLRMLSGDHLGVDFPGARQIRSLAERTRTSPGPVLLCATPLSFAFEMLSTRWSTVLCP